MTAPPPQPWGAYLHVPWCRRRCAYCAFVVAPRHEASFERFAERALADHAARRGAFPASSPVSLYLGGGTPSLLPIDVLRRLVEAMGERAIERTAEVNPEDAESFVDGALEAGINRVSLGVQTFHPKYARLLNRTCSAPRAHAVARRIATMPWRSWSIDLIFALPGQTVAELDHDLDRIVDLGVPHVSLYGLTFEEGTPFRRARDLGRLHETDDGTWRTLYDRCVERMAAAGLRRYEVSNFARPGHESVHNRLYWTDAPYLGLGPSAHGYRPDGARTAEIGDVAAWLAGEPGTVEQPTPRQAFEDLLVGGLRGVDGITRAHLRRGSGHDVSDAVVGRLVASDLLADDPGRLRLGAEGWPVADGVVAALVRSGVCAT